MARTSVPFVARQLINLTKEEIRVAAQTEDGRRQIMVTLEPVGEKMREELLKKGHFDEIFTMLIVDQEAIELAKGLDRKQGDSDFVLASVPEMAATCEVETEDGLTVERVTVSRLATFKSGHDVVLEVKAA